MEDKILEKTKLENIADSYGELVFSIKTMRNYLSEAAYSSLRSAIKDGMPLDASISDEVAEAMKNWAVSKGATHYTHWFQPLTGATAEKHDSFIEPDGEGGAILKFSGKELIQGEPDASSFPSGGLRATFEARGYTGWDPTSPAFIRGTTMCIPTVFYSYTGEALDKKIPLLRSIDAVSKQIIRLAKLFGIKGDQKPFVTMGPEQEYFLIDEEFYLSRLDLLQTGRTLFGKTPAKHQQLDDHYFGTIKPRVMAFMDELDRTLWELGVPAKTRHNEVCPAQFEVAPVFEDLNLAVDHNMLVMETLPEIAERHGFKCLLHEKPFAGVNGSGKHNNWAISGPDGKNWLSPGDNPHENAKFITIICALMKAIDTYAGLLRATVASAGNDHRLGANEAPPAIISIFLGEQLSDIIDQIETGGAKSSKSGGVLEIGVSALPAMPRDVTDRNRTSPFAFTGNKFEFRAVGSNQSCAGADIVLNTIVADALEEICSELDTAVSAGKDFNESLQSILQKIVVEHKRILFNGDNYTQAWHEEAEKRGLPNLKTTPEALEELKKPEVKALFERHKVLSAAELESRYEIYKEQYDAAIVIEASVALDMAKTLILPSALEYQAELAEAVNGTKACGCESKALKETLKSVAELSDAVYENIGLLEKEIASEKTTRMKEAMTNLRTKVDELEAIVPSLKWPLASYAEMMFIV